ncbi:MAG: hypothetical protein GY696_33460, partial [Gammaproteobacteria bacterium]|nr:hypothetical protein [Gammaproteobacteria bacterium]
MKKGENDHQTCRDLPKACANRSMANLIYLLISENFTEPNRPLYLNIFMPFFEQGAYRAVGWDVDIESYDFAMETAEELAGNMTFFQLKGAYFGASFKLKNIGFYFISDLRFAISAFLLCFLSIWAFSRSLFYAFMVLLCLEMSLGVAHFLYIYIFQIPFFPILNFMVLVLVAGIGA